MKKVNEFKKLRVLNGLSQEEVSSLLHYSQQNISVIERMEDSQIKDYLLKLQEVLGNGKEETVNA